MNTIERERTDYAAWLASLKVGDTAVKHGYYGFQRQKMLVTVTRLLATCIVTIDHSGQQHRFRLANGAEVGNSRASIVQSTPELAQKIEHERLTHWFKNQLPTKDLSHEQLRALYAAVQTITAEAKPIAVG